MATMRTGEDTNQRCVKKGCNQKNKSQTGNNKFLVWAFQIEPDIFNGLFSNLDSKKVDYEHDLGLRPCQAGAAEKL